MLTQCGLVNVIPTERSDEGSLKPHMRYLPYGRYDKNVMLFVFGSTSILLLKIKKQFLFFICLITTFTPVTAFYI